MKFKPLPGTTPDSGLTREQREILGGSFTDDSTGKNINYYVPAPGGVNMFAEGTTVKTNRFIDTTYWLDWLVWQLQTSLFGLFYTTSRLPQTPSGIARIRSTVESVCELGRFNGGIAPGRFSGNIIADIRTTTGSTFNGYTSTGHYVYISPIAVQSQADRVARKSPFIYVWLKGSGAIHSSEIGVSFTD